MPEMPAALKDAVEQCRSRIDEDWGDVDTDDDEAVKASSPLWRLVESLGRSGPEDVTRLRLARLAFFAARRALTCWELYCDGDGPRRAVEAVGRWIGDEEVNADWDDLSVAAAPAYRGVPISDCRFCDTSCAAEAAAHAALFVRGGDIDDAYRCCVYADMAFDQSPFGESDHFREWLLDLAVPAAFEGREMTASEREALREYDASEIPVMRDEQSAEEELEE
jgi:hypothetical protein